jgi:ParB-like chromosome segregation protein Spo0J
MPSNYVRGPKGFNEEWAKELAVIAAQSAGWPFAPLEVFVITDEKKGRKYEVNNGAHRLWAAVKNKVKSIPVQIETFATPGDAFAAQLMATMKSGTLKLDLDARDAAIRQLVLHLKMDRKKVMDLSGLSEGSISRIIAEKQRTGETGKRRGKKKKTARKAVKSGAGNGGFAPLDWYAGLAALVESFKTNGDAIIRARVQVQPTLLADGFRVASAVVSGELPANMWNAAPDAAVKA